MLWRTILVPYDFSPCSRRAVDLAIAEAGTHGAGLVLLHVVELMPRFGPESTLILPEDSATPIGIHAYFRRRAEADLAGLARALAGSVAVRWMVREQPIDVIAMGTHGRTGLRHALVGSVAERVVRASPVPVFTVR
ncbi:MAG TPA: universal stress protein [Kofleriaceae bacterium]